MRIIEISLMSLPLVLVLAWFLSARQGSFRVIALLACALAVLGGVLFWIGNHRSFSGEYRPAQFKNGRVVPSQGN